MKRLAFLLLLGALLTAPARADDAMTKVVFRQEAPDVAPGSFASKPKTLYRWERTKGRVEEALDPAHQLQGLFIADGKDGWFINLVSHTGQHLVDPSTDNTFYVPIVPQESADKPAPLREFEIGRELAFMNDHHVAPKPATKDGQSFFLYEYSQAPYTVQFYVSASTGKPTESDVLKDGKFLLRLVYLEYSPALPPDPALFRPPSSVTLTEVQPKH